MKVTVRWCAAAALTVVSGSTALAEPVDALITADNHYALYTTADTGLLFVGRNEIGNGGNPGQYNWSRAEPWAFNATDYFYIAAWSDDSVAQGVLAQVLFGGGTLHSGDARWEVYHTNIDRDSNDAAPDLMEMNGHISTASLGGLWEKPYVGELNGAQPWGVIPGVTTEARWMWWNTPGDADPLRGATNAGEMLVFRVAVPAPGAAAFLGLAGIAASRRRR